MGNYPTDEYNETSENIANRPASVAEKAMSTVEIEQAKLRELVISLANRLKGVMRHSYGDGIAIVSNKAMDGLDAQKAEPRSVLVSGLQTRATEAKHIREIIEFIIDNVEV